MELQTLHLISLTALAFSVVALGVSLLALYPGLKDSLVVARDAVLWVALFFVLGGAGFLGWNQWQQPKKTSSLPETTKEPSPASGFTAEGESSTQ